jgi:hypothetical protein
MFHHYDLSGQKEIAGDHSEQTIEDLRRDNQEKTRALLGDEIWQRYRGGLFTVSENAFASLAVRLSYTSTPLSAHDVQSLSDLLVSGAVAPFRSQYAYAASLEFIDRARTLLQPTQVEAMIQLYDEHEAWKLRAQLPATSVLPRNVRAAKRTPPP